MKSGIAIFGLALALGVMIAVGWRLIENSSTPDAGHEAPSSRAGQAALAPLAVPQSERASPASAAFPATVEDCVERNNRATNLLAAGDFRAAVKLFRACVHEVPEEKVYSRNLFEALVRLARSLVETDHDLKAGIDSLAQALELEVERADRADLVDLLGRWRAEWSVTKDDLVEPSLYFELVYDPNRQDLLYRTQEVMDLLDRAYVEMTEWFLVDPVASSARKIRVTFYNSEEFDLVTGLGDWAGGVFDGTIRLAVDALGKNPERWSRVARHELVHAFVRALGGEKVPGWLNEGLAQWLDYSSFANSRRTQEVANARALMKGVELFPFARLEGSLATWSDRDAIARAYAQSLGMVDFLSRYYGRDTLIFLVSRAADAGGVSAAFRARTSVDLDTILIDLASELAH